jgi:peptidoglycan biosynthesis protein MviN/MurJ (putative lipid II flippase)
MTLPFVAVTRALLTFFYSRLNMVVPFQNRLLNVVVNTGAASALVWAFDLRGLAFAYLLATMASLAHAVIRSDAGALLLSRRMAAVAVRVISTTLVAALAARLMFSALSPTEGTSKIIEAMLVGGSIVGGVAIVALLYALTGTRLQLRSLRRKRNTA